MGTYCATNRSPPFGLACRWGLLIRGRRVTIPSNERKSTSGLTNRCRDHVAVRTSTPPVCPAEDAEGMLTACEAVWPTHRQWPIPWRHRECWNVPSDRTQQVLNVAVTDTIRDETYCSGQSRHDRRQSLQPQATNGFENNKKMVDRKNEISEGCSRPSRPSSYINPPRTPRPAIEIFPACAITRRTIEPRPAQHAVKF